MRRWTRGFAVAALSLALSATILLPRVSAMSLDAVFNALVAERGVSIETDLAYSPHPRHRLDIYRAAPEQERGPVVVFYYGGGWTKGDRATYRFLAAALAKRGLTTVVPDYRLFPEVQFPAFVDDAALAYRWTAERLAATCPGGRPIVVMGHSAGGYMAAMIALDEALTSGRAAGLAQPAAFVGLAGPYAFDPTTWPTTRAIFTPAAKNPDRARPVAFARPGAPPTLLLHGSADTTVKLFNTRDLAAALLARGNSVRSIEYPDVGHVGLVLAFARPMRWRAPVLDDVVAFIEARAGATPVGRPCAAGFARPKNGRSAP
jgi:acetyl esterase/lipase